MLHRWFIFVISIALPAVACAEPSTLPTFKLSGGLFISHLNTELQVNSRTIGRGTRLNLENLGLTQSTRVGRLDGYLRLFQRHRIQFGYFRFYRTVGAHLKNTIQVGNVTFPAGAGVDLTSDNRNYMLNYMYSFIQNDQLELAGSLGLHIMNITNAIRGTGGRLSQSSSVTGPMPMLGLNLDYHFSKRLLGSLQGQWFAIKYDGYTGVLQDYSLRLEYMFWDHAGIGVGYNAFNLGVSVDRGNFLGRLDWRYSGLQLFGTVAF